MPHHPRHRRTPARSRVGALAVAAALLTGGVVAVGATTDLGGAVPSQAAGASLASAPLSAEELAEREDRVSRSTDRAAVVDAGKADRLASDAGVSRSGSRDLSDADPKVLARALMGEYGLAAGEFSCLEQLWEKESGWSTTADNPTSSAYGIPQALPGEKMSAAGGDWATSAETQIRWGLGYIRDRYGSACGAWGHSQSNNWY